MKLLTGRGRAWTPLISMLMVFGLMLAACPADEDEPGDDVAEPTDAEPTDEVPEEPADFIYGINGVPSTLDIIGVYEGDTTRRVMYEIGSSLVEYDAEGLDANGCNELATIEDFKGDLAESWEVFDDGSVEFRLREGVMSTEGNELTADDVVWSLNRAHELGPVVGFLYNAVAAYVDEEPFEVVDEYTVRLDAEPASLNVAVQTWGQNIIYDTTAIFEAVGSEDFVEASEYLTENVPNFGPWQLSRFDPGAEVEFVANENYWNADARGNIERLIFRDIAESSTRMSLVQTGEIDYTRGLAFDEFDSLAGQPGAVVQPCTSPDRDMLMVNLDDERFADQRVRQAISLAIDREAIVEGVYRGFGSPATTGLSQIAYDFPDPELTFEHDPDRARELLEEAGHGDGFSFQIVASPTRPGAHAESVALLIQSMLGDIGLDVSLDIVAGAADFSDQFFAGEYEAILYNEPPAVADAFYSLGLYNATWSFQNTHNYDNERYDELTRAIDETEPGPARDALMQEVSDLIVEDVPVVYLVERQYVNAWSDAVNVNDWLAAPHSELKVVNIFKDVN